LRLAAFGLLLGCGAFEASGGRFLALQIYAPGGPEQRFKALAGK